MRKIKVPGGVIKQRYFRLLQKDHAIALRSIGYYKGEE